MTEARKTAFVIYDYEIGHDLRVVIEGANKRLSSEWTVST